MQTAVENVGSWNLNTHKDYLKTGNILGKTHVLELIPDYLQNKNEKLPQSHKI